MAKQNRRSSEHQLKRQQYWQMIIAKWGKSGLSQAAFCRRHKLQAQQFSQWKVRLAKAAKIMPKLTTDADFVEIKRPVFHSVYEIITPDDYRIRIEGDSRSEVIASVLAAARQSC